MTRYATLDLPILNYWGGEYFATVPATIIHDVAPHLAHMATFAVHRSTYVPDLWIVSHVETGGRIGPSERRRQDTIDNAIALLALYTPSTLAAHVRRAVKSNPEIAR